MGVRIGHGNTAKKRQLQNSNKVAITVHITYMYEILWALSVFFTMKKEVALTTMYIFFYAPNFTF